MADIYLFNSLSRKKEKFIPINPPNVGMYTCGPTVYDRKHIGNFRTYTLSDLLVRTLIFKGYKVKHVMNFTDVGHLTGDNEGDADTGEDRLVKAAKKERKTAWEIAKEYTEIFLGDFKKLNLLAPYKFVKATDHISEQIELIKKLEEKSLTYKISDGIYFDTVAFEKNLHKKYGELSTLDEIKKGARIEPNPEKKNIRDFALWKFSPKGEKRDMEWPSPWGVGFPGWHIECSAMSMEYLGETFDIHVGGEDLRSTHHPNEIAQSEGATGKTFVKYWVHGAFVLIDGERMSTSKGNNYKVEDIIDHGYDPLALRYLYLGTHYKKQLNFTWDALSGSQVALNKLRETVSGLRSSSERNVLSNEKMQKVEDYRKRFNDALEDDINTPQALSVLWEAIKSNIPSQDKYDLILSFDEVLGLNLSQASTSKIKTPDEIKKMLEERDRYRSEKDFQKADLTRQKIEEKGYTIKDTSQGTLVTKK